MTRTAACMALLLVLGCKRREYVPPVWLGMDRSAVSCALGHAWLGELATCIGASHVYQCISDDGAKTWRCAEVHAVTKVEAQ